MKNKKQTDEPIMYIPIGLSIGLSIGVAVGAAAGDIPLWMCIGLSIGVGIGAVIDNQKRQKAEDRAKSAEEAPPESTDEENDD